MMSHPFCLSTLTAGSVVVVNIPEHWRVTRGAVD